MVTLATSTEQTTTFVTMRSCLTTKHLTSKGWSVCKVAINLATHLHSIRKIQLYTDTVWQLLTKIMKLCCRPRPHGLQCLTDSHWLCTALPPTHLCFPFLYRCRLGGYHGNQDGYAAKTGGAIIPDVSWYKTVLPDQEEELHFQVQTRSTDIQ